MEKLAKEIPVLLALMFIGALPALAQSNSGTVRGSVLDPSGAVIAGAAVTLQNPVSHYTRSVITDNQGQFQFPNIPYNNYHVSVTAAGFQAATQDIDVRSPVPLDLKISLPVGAETQTVTVEAGADLVEKPIRPRTRMWTAPCSTSCRSKAIPPSLSSLVTLASPGVAADSNGLFHGLGDHASNSFSLDGQPITDQQSKVFSNQIPLDAVQSMEVIEGAPPAEYGDKTSVVIVVTTRSGLGVTQPHGDVTASYGTLRHRQRRRSIWPTASQNWGNFISGQRHGHRPVPGWAGIPGLPRSWQRRERFRPRRFQAFRRPTRST